VPAKSAVHIIACGGTFDKIYNPDTYTLDFPDKTHVYGIVSFCSLQDVMVTHFLQKDSLDVTTEDMEKLQEIIKESQEDRILVVFGTSKIDVTASSMAKERLEKTVVFCGAYVPFSMTNSDALFNFGAGLMAARLMDFGTYVCLHGELFDLSSSNGLPEFIVRPKAQT